MDMTYLQSISESAMFSYWTQLSSWLCAESRSRHGLRVCTALQGHVILLAVRDESLLSSPESSESNNCYFWNLFMHFLWFSFCVSANNLTHHQSVSPLVNFDEAFTYHCRIDFLRIKAFTMPRTCDGLWSACIGRLEMNSDACRRKEDEVFSKSVWDFSPCFTIPLFQWDVFVL